jgi:hypothetical protein
LRAILGGEISPPYSDVPTWSAWRGWEGEHFSVVAVVGSVLVVNRSDSDSAYVFDGQRWTTLLMPDSMDLRPYIGSIPDGRFLSINQRAGQPERPQYRWLSLSPGGFALQESLPSYAPDLGRPYWWSDGNNLVTWSLAVQRLTSGGWTREPTGTSGSIRKVWGADISRRFAIPSRPSDSLLVYDGISWDLVDIFPNRSLGTPLYRVGTTFPDGTSVVVGEVCDEVKRCSPLIIQQDTFGGPWQVVSTPSAIGIPLLQQRDTSSWCDPDRFTLDGAYGTALRDYYVWGSWDMCERAASGCPPDRPCVWHVEDGDLHPVHDLAGRLVQAMVTLEDADYALLDDATLWRQIGSRWRAVTQVPHLPTRLAAASEHIVVLAAGSNMHHEPGHGDTASTFFLVSPLAERTVDSMPPRSVVVRDSTIALLAADGSVSISECPVSHETLGDIRRCRPWVTLPPAPSAIRAISFLEDGQLLQVGASGLVRTWKRGSLAHEVVPTEVMGDSLWHVVRSSNRGALAVGTRMVIQRDSVGRWMVVRRFSDRLQGVSHFARLTNGDLVVADLGIFVWDLSVDSLPVAAIRIPQVSNARIGAIHALPDGRLVAGFALPDEPTLGGWLEVWAAPARDGSSERLDLPQAIDITDLADDGLYLYVVGQGGALSIPLDSLPFASEVSRN